MIFFAMLICSYVFWKTLYQQMGYNLDDYFPVKNYISHITACGA